MIEEYTLNLIDWIVEMPLVAIYSFFLLIAYAENVFPPIPGDLLVVFGGYIAVEQVVDFSTILVITTVGSVLGFMTLYYVGYRLGDEIRAKPVRFRFIKHLDGKYMNKVELWMYRWGQGVIFANRFLAGTRSIISIVAGVSKTKISSTVFFATCSALLWNLLLLMLGWYIGENWPVIQQYLNIYGTSLLTVIAIIVAIRVGIYFYKKRKNRQKKNYPETD
jgi:membrane protein DedA with SNARE-associated domain